MLAKAPANDEMAISKEPPAAGYAVLSWTMLLHMQNKTGNLLIIPLQLRSHGFWLLGTM